MRSNIKLFILPVFIFVLLMPSHYIKAQTKLEMGPLIGVSWYNGELNRTKQFYNMHPSAGILLRYLINDRIAFRTGVTAVTISGEYPTSRTFLKEYHHNNHYEFKRTVGDISFLTEFNFLSFDKPHTNDTNFSPYITAGLASTFYKSYKEVEGELSEKPTFVLSLPFGAGLKWKPTENMQVGIEWTFRKTFANDLDLKGFNTPIDPSDPFDMNESAIIHNNDWYSIFGVHATFSIFTKDTKCYDGF
ncbi:DUF6089 family protein [Marinilabiliaceae bacterium ANBcel2]|nr:DUF6089 family protein [Marinilabiliaceae bacterium ANBcel2]